jgi:hypothetical protein
MTDDHNPELVLVLGAARSGTTLLRSFLDAHPDIGCPAEAGVPNLLNHLHMVWDIVCSSRDPAHGTAPRDPEREDQQQASCSELPAEVQDTIRGQVMRVMRYYCEPDAKGIYCDKSLDNVRHVAAVDHMFPGTKCIVMVRQVMDTIASGLEASPWGFDAFGYRPFVEVTPENTVHALARYWESQVSQALAWRDAHGDRCHVIRYEDLVTDPESVLGRLFEFLGVAEDLSVIERSFEAFTKASGPGDYKIGSTRKLSADSIGRGKRVPVARIAPPVLERINGLLAKLGYPQMGESWSVEPNSAATASEEARDELERLLSCIASGDWDFAIETVGVVADDADLRWVVMPASATVRRGDGEVDLVLAGAAEDLVRLINGGNVGALLRSGLIRYVVADPEIGTRVDVSRLLGSLARRLRGEADLGTGYRECGDPNASSDGSVPALARP